MTKFRVSVLLLLLSVGASADFCEGQSCPTIDAVRGDSLLQTSSVKGEASSVSEESIVYRGPEDVAFQALQKQVADLVEQVAAQKEELDSLVEELSDTKNDLAKAQEQLDEAGDKIWELTPKEELPEEGQHVFLACKSSGQPKTINGHTFTFTDAQCGSLCGNNPAYCEPTSQFAGLCECSDESSEEKLAKKACEGKRDRDECEWRIEDRKVTPLKKGGNKTDYKATVFQSLCDKGKCIPYKSLYCHQWSRSNGTTYKPVGTRCVNTKHTDSASCGYCRGTDFSTNRKTWKWCATKTKMKTYQLSKCVVSKNGAGKTTCEPGYNPEWDSEDA